MSRWIDADKVKEALKQNTPRYMWGEILTTVNVQPYIDLVRCAECKWAKANGAYQWCGRLDSTARITADDFCSYGRRKESE